MTIKNPAIAILVAVGASLSLPDAAFAQNEETIEEIITTGTRSAKPRSASDSPVPIDVINTDDFSAMGNTADLTDNIRALAPVTDFFGIGPEIWRSDDPAAALGLLVGAMG